MSGQPVPSDGTGAAGEPVDPLEYRRAIGRFATGVTVVTTFAGRHDHAMTANSVTSVSLYPVLMLVSVEQDSRWHEAVAESGVWGVSILGEHGRPTAEWLASPGRPLHGQLDRIAHHRGPQTGVALLDGALATLECRTVAAHPAGDHTLVVGEVLSVESPARVEAALVHFRGRYGILP
ncbi:flavin reductase family protein [Ornithinicoccus hortensis]|uniref:Flavin reductase (DIM6/NTAB) family NADH-FMN oxidoreductase RutF n=1 Tax=Ornithinicoccus hortensis TaxID=82346 RepID=A0A542YPV1_9MICO|nr:flavin reductase family protein [Ornithinicoccus hortensis]TQL50130.1 flavin reductase (DIM6/NTAB) family NADH-FMN oxidoreductase RutF [Ornithinicoccus hortensis]